MLKYRGEWSRLVDWTFSPAIHPGQVNRVAVLAEGDELYCYINDQLVAQVSDDHLPRGCAGLSVELYDPGDEAVLEFDNWLIRAP